MLVREVISESYVRAELFKTCLTLLACAVRVDHAADSNDVAGLELRYSRAGLGDTANNLMARNTGVDRGDRTAPLITGLVQIRMTDSAEENFDLHVCFGWIAPRDRSGRKRR